MKGATIITKCLETLGVEHVFGYTGAAIAKLSHFRFAQRVEERGALPEAMNRWLRAQGPAMLEVLTDMEEAIYPVVRPGSSYAEMDLGPYIREREEILPSTAVLAT